MGYLPRLFEKLDFLLLGKNGHVVLREKIQRFVVFLLLRSLDGRQKLAGRDRLIGGQQQLGCLAGIEHGVALGFRNFLFKEGHESIDDVSVVDRQLGNFSQRFEPLICELCRRGGGQREHVVEAEAVPLGDAALLLHARCLHPSQLGRVDACAGRNRGGRSTRRE